MFDARKALEPLSGKTFQYRDLKEELGKIRLEHISDLPPEFGTHELFLLALKSEWLDEKDNGEISVKL